MPIYQRKPETINGVQWFKNGDHPLDECKLLKADFPDAKGALTEGKIVRRYRAPDNPVNYIDGGAKCKLCGHTFHEHGWIDIPGCESIVCPADYVLDSVIPKMYDVIHPAEFDKLWENQK